MKHGEVSHGRGLFAGPRIQDIPDVDLGTTTAVWPDACIGIICGGSPALHVGLECGVSARMLIDRVTQGSWSHLAANELQVASTLSVTVADTVLGASLVVGLLGHATILRNVNY